MLPVEFQGCVKAYNEKQETNMQKDYMLSRFNAWLILAPDIKENTTQEDLISFSWEKREIKKGKVREYAKDSVSKIKPPT